MKYAITILAISIASLGFTLPQAVTATAEYIRVGGSSSMAPVRVTITNPTSCY